MDDAAIHRVSGNAFDLSLRLLAHSGSPRTFSPRDDKGGLSAKCLSLRGGRKSDAAIHRVSGNADDLSLRLLDHSGSPRTSPSR